MDQTAIFPTKMFLHLVVLVKMNTLSYLFQHLFLRPGLKQVEFKALSLKTLLRGVFIFAQLKTGGVQHILKNEGMISIALIY